MSLEWHSFLAEGQCLGIPTGSWWPLNLANQVLLQIFSIIRKILQPGPALRTTLTSHTVLLACSREVPGPDGCSLEKEIQISQVRGAITSLGYEMSSRPVSYTE